MVSPVFVYASCVTYCCAFWTQNEQLQKCNEEKMPTSRLQDGNASTGLLVPVSLIIQNKYHFHS